MTGDQLVHPGEAVEIIPVKLALPSAPTSG
jgi:hypothetical protein